MKVLFIVLALSIAGCGKTSKANVAHSGQVFIDGDVDANGRTQLIVKFPNGETQVIATETRP